MNSDWYCKRLLNAYSQPQTSEEYDDAWECSDAWMKSESFKNYFSENSLKFSDFTYGELKNNPSLLQSEGFGPGDVIIFETLSSRHVGVITENSVSSSLGITFGATYHTSSRLNKNLFETAEGLNFYNWNKIYVVKFA